MSKDRRTLKTLESLFGILIFIQDLQGCHGEAKCRTNVSAEIEYFTCSYKAEALSGQKANT